MTTQSDLYDAMTADVITLTNRPDLVAETALAVRTATLSIHTRAAFPRDVQTELVKLTNSVYLVALDAQVLLPRLRGLSTVRACDVSYVPLEQPRIEIVELGDIYDPEYHTLKNNIAYLAGTAVNIRCSVPSYGFLIEYLGLPLMRREQYNSWIAQLAPESIVYMAAATVLSTNGDLDKSKKFFDLVNMTLVPELVSSFLTSQQR